jgi:Trypsin-co-occurring domain 2
MSVSLKDFVQQALLEITTAVNNAKKHSPLSIAPGFVEGKIQLEPQMIEFSVHVSVSEQNSKSGKGEVSVPIIQIVKAAVDGEVSSKNEQTTTQVLKFSVPVYFQAKTEL